MCLHRFRPRILIDVSKIDMATTILGFKLSMPIMVAPTAFQKMAHPEGKKLSCFCPESFYDKKTLVENRVFVGSSTSILAYHLNGKTLRYRELETRGNYGFKTHIASWLSQTNKFVLTLYKLIQGNMLRLELHLLLEPSWYVYMLFELLSSRPSS